MGGDFSRLTPFYAAMNKPDPYSISAQSDFACWHVDKHVCRSVYCNKCIVSTFINSTIWQENMQNPMNSSAWCSALWPVYLMSALHEAKLVLNSACQTRTSLKLPRSHLNLLWVINLSKFIRSQAGQMVAAPDCDLSRCDGCIWS